jgi:ABC-2 type transport system permease protein
MLDRLFGLVGVDYRQWKALVITALRLDFRSGSARMQHQEAQGWFSGPVRLIAVYMVVGLLISTLIWQTDDVYISGLVYLSILGFLIGVIVLLEFNSVVISPHDHRILAYQPVSSPTYFFARLANVLIYTSLLTSAFAFFPTLAFTYRDGLNASLGLAALAASYGASVAVTLTMLVLYLAILRYMPPRHLRSVLSYTQLVLSFVVYAGFIFFRGRTDWSDLPDLSPQAIPFMLLYPMTWFATYLELALGNRSLMALVPSLLSGVWIVGLLAFSARRLSLDYSERLALLDSAQDERPPAARHTRPSLFFPTREGRAMALLITRQFRYDTRFRLGVLGVLPLTALYLYIGLGAGPLPDPFLGQPANPAGIGLIHLAILVSPALLIPRFIFSDAFLASWIYHVTPARPGNLVRSMKNYIFVYFVAPYMVCVAAVFAFYFESLYHALAHAVVLALIAHFFVLLALVVNRGLPFSAPVQRSRFTVRVVAPFAVAPLAAFGALPGLMAVGYTTPLRVVLLVVGLALVNWAADRWVASHVDRLAPELQYLG